MTKKLQTQAIRLDSGEFELSAYSGWAAVHHDARIAHEQREVIRQLSTTMKLNLADLQFAEACCRRKGLPGTASCLASILSALKIDLAAAAPYLED